VARRLDKEPPPSAETDKIANLLALLVVRDLPAGEAIVTLTRAGFSTTEVCRLLHTTAVNVRQANFQARKTNKRKRAPAK
jgi:hypothetical protein